MKIVQINAVIQQGSTGKICFGISKLLSESRIENYVLYSAGSSDYENSIRYMSPLEVKAGAVSSRILGNWGFNSFFATKKLIKYLKQIDPDVIHIHNVHGHNCHLGLLWEYLNNYRAKVIWTFHDCWAFTGYCMHYDMIGCDRWKSECRNCPQKKEYSWFLDRSSNLFARKRKLYYDADITVVTPSQWLAEQVEMSFLSGLPVKVINNGIDLDIFSPRASSFKEKHNIKNKKTVLGVAFGWGRKKGIDVFVNLAEVLSSEYQIVLVGTDDNIDKTLPDNVISIHRTQDQRELAEIYSAADVFVNPTREENYPTVNMESLACGTPVVTFDTGGSAEIIDETCGVVVRKNDVNALLEQIIRICSEKPFTREACVKKAKQFDMNDRYKEYIDLYEEVANDRTSKN